MNACRPTPLNIDTPLLHHKALMDLRDYSAIKHSYMNAYRHTPQSVDKRRQTTSTTSILPWLNLIERRSCMNASRGSVR